MGPAGPTASLTIHGPIARSDLPGLYRRACAALQGRPNGVLVCEVSGVPVDVVTIEALAGLALGARRQGCGVWLQGASVELLQLVELVGRARCCAATDRLRTWRVGRPKAISRCRCVRDRP